MLTLRQDQKWIYGALAGLLFFASLALFGRMWESYDGLWWLDRTVSARWVQLDGSCQRRLDLATHLASALREGGQPDSVLEEAVRAFVLVHEKTPKGRAAYDAASLEMFETAQSSLSAALAQTIEWEGRNAAGSAIQLRGVAVELDILEQRIQKARLGFNEAARAFNAKVDRFPSVLVASLFSDRRYAAKPLLEETGGRSSAP